MPVCMVYMLRHTHGFSLYFVAHTYSNSSTLCCCCCIFVCEQTSIPKRQTYTKTVSSFIYSRLACVCLSCGWMVYWCVSVIHYPHSFSMYEYVCMHVERCVVQLHVREQTYIHFSLPYTHLAYTSYSCFIHNTAVMIRIHKDRQYNDNDTDVYHLHFVFHRAVCFSYRIHKSCVRVFWQLCTLYSEVKQAKSRDREKNRQKERKKQQLQIRSIKSDSIKTP